MPERERYKVLYYCQTCGDGWPSKRSRANHESAKHGAVRVGRKPGPEPVLGTDQHYQWCLRRGLEPPALDQAAHAEYQRDYYAKKRRGVK